MELVLTQIPGCPDCWITRDGTVWRRHRRKPNANGYTYYMLHRHCFQLGYLLLITFVGPCPPGMECHHKDGNPRNNALDNLVWSTPTHRGSKGGPRKLTAIQITEIRRALAEGASPLLLADRYNITLTTIYQVKKCKGAYKHVLPKT